MRFSVLFLSSFSLFLWFTYIWTLCFSNFSGGWMDLVCRGIDALKIGSFSFYVILYQRFRSKHSIVWWNMNMIRFVYEIVIFRPAKCRYIISRKWWLQVGICTNSQIIENCDFVIKTNSAESEMVILLSTLAQSWSHRNEVFPVENFIFENSFWF